MNNQKPKLIILEGSDRCGKTSLQLALNKRFKYNHIILDRGPVGFQTYHEIFDRDPQTKEYLKMEKQIRKTNHLMIYLECETWEQIIRCKNTNEEIQDFDYHKEVYRKYYNKSKLNKVKIDTTFCSTEEIIDYLIKEKLL